MRNLNIDIFKTITTLHSKFDKKLCRSYMDYRINENEDFLGHTVINFSTKNTNYILLHNTMVLRFLEEKFRGSKLILEIKKLIKICNIDMNVVNIGYGASKGINTNYYRLYFGYSELIKKYLLSIGFTMKISFIDDIHMCGIDLEGKEINFLKIYRYKNNNYTHPVIDSYKKFCIEFIFEAKEYPKYSQTEERNKIYIRFKRGVIFYKHVNEFKSFIDILSMRDVNDIYIHYLAFDSDSLLSSLYFTREEDNRIANLRHFS